MQKLESNYERRKKEIQELIEKELKIYISELNKFVGIMKSEEDWANKFDTPKWILSVNEQIATVEKEYSACICLKENAIFGFKPTSEIQINNSKEQKQENNILEIGE